MRPRRPAIERFDEKRAIQPSGCWEWTAARLADGYGTFFDGEKVVLAHRWAYEHFVGPIPEGLALDHLCRNHGCVNPEHLEPVTWRTNTMRGETIPAAHAAKTHCPSGHAYDEDNTLRYGGRRYCRACRSERTASRSGRMNKVSA
jgi:hypothetical protein